MGGGVQPKTKRKKNKKPSVKNWSKLALKNWSKYVAQQNWTSFLTLEMVFLVCLFLFFLKHPLLSARRMRFQKQKNKKNKNMDQFLTLEKAKIGPAFNSTAYTYIYIYAFKQVLGPHSWFEKLLFLWVCPLNLTFLKISQVFQHVFKQICS